MEEIILPHDDLMERAILGAILAGHQQAAELLDSLKPDDFLNRWHQQIAESILALHEAGSRPDLLAVHDELVKNGDAEAAGGVAYVASLLEGIALKSDVLYVLRGLRRMAAFRQAMLKSRDGKTGRIKATFNIKTSHLAIAENHTRRRCRN